MNGTSAVDQIQAGKKRGYFFMRRVALFYRAMKRALPFACLFFLVARVEAQIQVDLRLKRLQHIAYEPVMATLGITNLAGRDVDLHHADGQPWFGLEVTGSEGQPIAPVTTDSTQLPLKIEAGKRVTQRINLASLYPVHDFGTYHVRAHVYCAAPRSWAYSRVGLNGELLARSSFMETKTRPRLFHTADGAVAMRGGMLETPAAQSARNRAPKLSDRPAKIPKDD